MTPNARAALEKELFPLAQESQLAFRHVYDADFDLGNILLRLKGQANRAWKIYTKGVEEV